jgi:large subunit ribosomal protein L21
VSVTAEIVDHHRGPKIDILKYKNKTGYRRRQGYRSELTTVKVNDIKTGK